MITSSTKQGLEEAFHPKVFHGNRRRYGRLFYLMTYLTT